MTYDRYVRYYSCKLCVSCTRVLEKHFDILSDVSLTDWENNNTVTDKMYNKFCDLSEKWKIIDEKCDSCSRNNSSNTHNNVYPDKAFK